MSALLNEVRKIKKQLLMDEKSFDLYIAKSEEEYKSIENSLVESHKNVAIIMKVYKKEFTDGNRTNHTL